jgi:signal transduction histidine kinase
MAKYDILLIGGGANLLKTIRWVLEYKGFAVKVAASPEAALEALVKKNYDLVLAKLATDDQETLGILARAKQLNPGVKLLALSGNNHAIFPLEAYQVEVDDYLLMPVSPSELWRRVSRCLEDREVMDLQPLKSAAASSRAGALTRAPMRLMLHDFRGAVVSTAAALKLMDRGAYGEISEPGKTKLREVTGRIEKTIHLAEDCIGESSTDLLSEGRDQDCYDLIEDIVEPVLEELAAEIQDRQITLVNRLNNQQEGQFSVRGSKRWLKSVFRDLMNNAIKYGGQGCTIRIDCEMQGARCRLTVYNTGQTVPKAHRAILFSPSRGMRLSKKHRQGQGQGQDLGLSLSRGGANFMIASPQS